MQKLKLYRPYLIIIFIFALIGMLISFGAQRGGINQLNGFIAPIIGPWSRFLDPNGAYTLKRFDLYAAIVTVFLLASIYFAPRVKNKTVRIIAIIATCILVAVWCFTGLGKVLVEMR
jgi:hypothetical protein